MTFGHINRDSLFDLKVYICTYKCIYTDTIKDIFLWKRKKLSILLVLVATVTWVLLDVYELNFVTVASWLTMIIVTSLFIYGNLVRLLHK